MVRLLDRLGLLCVALLPPLALAGLLLMFRDGCGKLRG